MEYKKKIIKPTPFGPVAVIWSVIEGSPKIIRVLLRTPERSAEYQARRLYPNSRTASCAKIDAVTAAMKAFLKGGGVASSLDVVNLKQCSRFQRSVLRAEHQIPRGRVSTYQLIARHLGKKGGARAVGNALAKNPFPLIVPCHRAIRSDRHLGGFQGGRDMKRVLLKQEGIVFDDCGRVVSARLCFS
jgi:methylated-DNA-[protein]-cysteine S-methyltransferase